MATKIIVSYDGTDNDHDALALGKLLSQTGASLELAYVRHTRELEGGREQQVQKEADALLERGAVWLGKPDLPRRVVFSASTPEGLAELAKAEDASVVVFGSEYRTTPDHVNPQTSAQRLLEGGPFAIALAPANLRDRPAYRIGTIAAIPGDGDPSAVQTAETLARLLGATVVDRGSEGADLLVVGSKLGTPSGRVIVSAAAAYLIETIRCPALVIPRDTPLDFVM